MFEKKTKQKSRRSEQQRNETLSRMKISTRVSRTPLLRCTRGMVSFAKAEKRVSFIQLSGCRDRFSHEVLVADVV